MVPPNLEALARRPPGRRHRGRSDTGEVLSQHTIDPDAATGATNINHRADGHPLYER